MTNPCYCGFIADLSLSVATATGTTVQKTLGDWTEQILNIQASGVPADSVNVMWFGAKGDGVTDDSEAFAKACSTGLTVRVPGRHFKVQEDSIILNTPGQSLIGAGVSSWIGSSFSGSGTLLDIINNSGYPAISVNENVGYSQIKGFTLTRSIPEGTASKGSNGIVFLGNSENCHLSDLIVDNQFIGMFIQSTSWGTIRNIVVQSCSSDGFYATNFPGFESFQWQLDTILSQKNAGYGFHFISNSASGSSQLTLGNIRHLATYANTGAGIYFNGSFGAPIQSVRMSDSFFGQDGTDEIILDSFGSDHYFSNVFIELAGTAPTGPTVSTPPSKIGNGCSVGASDSRIQFNNVLANACSDNGFNISGTDVSFSGCSATNNGSGANGGTGIVVNAGGSISAITGTKAKNTDGLSNQRYGLYNGGSVNVCVGNDFKPNSAGTYGGAAPLVGGSSLNNQ